MAVRCCDYTIIPFTNVATLNIAYSINMREQFGNIPHVKVYHKQPDNSYIEPMVMIGIDGNPANMITVNNGGVATGFLKIFK